MRITPDDQREMKEVQRRLAPLAPKDVIDQFSKLAHNNVRTLATSFYTTYRTLPTGHTAGDLGTDYMTEAVRLWVEGEHETPKDAFAQAVRNVHHTYGKNSVAYSYMSGQQPISTAENGDVLTVFDAIESTEPRQGREINWPLLESILTDLQYQAVLSWVSTGSWKITADHVGSHRNYVQEVCTERLPKALARHGITVDDLFVEVPDNDTVGI